MEETWRYGGVPAGGNEARSESGRHVVCGRCHERMGYPAEKCCTHGASFEGRCVECGERRDPELDAEPWHCLDSQRSLPLPGRSRVGR